MVMAIMVILVILAVGSDDNYYLFLRLLGRKEQVFSQKNIIFLLNMLIEFFFF